MQDYFIDFDYSQETHDYYPDDYDPSEEIIGEFRDSAKKVEDFKHTHSTRFRKVECQNDDELKKDIDNDKLYDALNCEKLRLDLDIQNLENQCFSANGLLNKYGLFLTVYELKEFCYLIKQDSEKNRILRELSSCIVEKFNGFNIARVEFSKKLRQPF